MHGALASIFIYQFHIGVTESRDLQCTRQISACFILRKDMSYSKSTLQACRDIVDFLKGAAECRELGPFSAQGPLDLRYLMGFHGPDRPMLLI